MQVFQNGLGSDGARWICLLFVVDGKDLRLQPMLGNRVVSLSSSKSRVATSLVGAMRPLLTWAPLPGLPHRTGHGIGLDVHEEPYIVRGDITPLVAGMCFSDEPTICIYGAFGVRLEDHIYMTETGPNWFTEPAFSFDDPFHVAG